VPAVFERLAVIGMGLVGGSVALAARDRGVAREVRGVDPALREASGIPLVSLEEAAAWADALVLAVPISAIDAILARLAPLLRPEAVLTDTASVKGPVAASARRHLRDPGRCVGAHPMAGGERSGFAHARSDLFEGAACILTPSPTDPREVVDRIEHFWQSLGALTVHRTPEEHDSICAALSHAPHVIAFAFARGLPERETLRLAGQGLRDFIRIARSNPRLWREILLMNRQRVAEEISRFEKQLGEMQEALARGDGEALEALLREAREAALRIESE
jgi:prephenate dehydrogenase